MQNLTRQIDSILRDKSLDDADGDSSRAEEIELLAGSFDWQLLQRALLNVLKDDSRGIDVWQVIATVFWGAVLDGRDIAADELIALVYYRLPPDGDPGESNLAWSIAAKIRGLDYLSEFDPLKDPNVRRYLPTG